MKEINNIWQFFENLNEYVYATDIETYEMVYMNRKTLEAYGLKSLDEIKGRKCYEILQKSSIPCGMCNNDKICEGFFEEWRHYNSIIDNVSDLLENKDLYRQMSKAQNPYGDGKTSQSIVNILL